VEDDHAGNLATPPRVPVRRVVSGGQTGVDRAALDAARRLGVPCGGWCPRGRRAEDGPIDPVYPLRETRSDRYPVRTSRNVRDSDGTLVLTRGRPTGGTALTIRIAQRAGRPLLVLDLDLDPRPDEAARWMSEHGITTVNVAGPRESERPGTYDRALAFLVETLTSIPATGSSAAGPG
jgi:hypothetical protein